MFLPPDHTFAVCAFGESPYLKECMESLVSQTVATNIIIATSTPNQLIQDTAKTYKVPLYISDTPSGICSDWNHAVSRAATPLVTIAHQDDIYGPNYAQCMLEAINHAQRPLLFFSNYGEIRDNKRINSNLLLRIKRLLLLPMGPSGIAKSKRKKRLILSAGSSICCPSVTMNMGYLPFPPFDSDMKSNLDWDAWERFSHLDGEFIYSKKILMYHRIHRDSETSALIEDNTRTQEDLEMLERFWPKPIAKLFNSLYAKAQYSNSIRHR